MRSLPLSLFGPCTDVSPTTLKFSVLRSASNDSSWVCNPRTSISPGSLSWRAKDLCTRRRAVRTRILVRSSRSRS